MKNCETGTRGFLYLRVLVLIYVVSALHRTTAWVFTFTGNKVKSNRKYCPCVHLHFP